MLLIGLFVALFLHDATTANEVVSDVGEARLVEAMPADVWPGLGPGWVLSIVLLPKFAFAGLYHMACLRTRRRLGTERGQASLTRLEALTTATPYLLLALFLVDLSAGALRTIRVPLTHVVLLDELVVMLPTLVVAALGWWSYYPVDRRLREAALFRLADEGRPLYPLLTRGGYVAMQLRHQFGVLLLPLLLVYGWAEAMVLLGPDHGGPLSARASMLLTPVGVGAVFVCSPLIIRYVWQTRPLAPGEVRERMRGLCAMHRVPVRELLLWRTSGRMVNAAVTGLFGRVRYILLSDGLLDRVSPREVEAVMAHEIAHVKCRHIVWMGVVLITTLAITEIALRYAIEAGLIPALGNAAIAAIASEIGIDLHDAEVQLLLTAAPAFALTLVVFGWVSRRIERQADVFAARHMARVSDEPAFDALGRQVFDDAAVDAMVHALQRVSELNHAPVHRKSWRHGSIAWRQDHLRSLVGRPIDRTPVDRVLTRVKIASLAGVTDAKDPDELLKREGGA
ncbi:MAG: M48 family metallopeptidase, partial [Phycisphaeraceae bacterium]